MELPLGHELLNFGAAAVEFVVDEDHGDRVVLEVAAEGFLVGGPLLGLHGIPKVDGGVEVLLEYGLDLDAVRAVKVAVDDDLLVGLEVLGL